MINDEMMARPKYNRTSQKYNVAVNYGGYEILLGNRSGIFVKYTGFDDKESAIKYIENKSGLKLAKNIEEMMLG